MKYWVFTVAILWAFLAHATHNRAGEITYRHVSGNTFDVTLITYTKDSAPADRPELVVKWGDGTQDTLDRVSQTILGNDIKRNIYEGRHTYPSVGTYVISMEDPNRNDGIVNIPNSVSVPFYIETILNINPLLGYNDSPVLLNPPIDIGCVNQVFIHNPSAYDPDGDSLSYRLVDCRGINGQFIPNFSLPSASNSISIDSVLGDFVWDTPVLAGEYNIAIEITEHRRTSSGSWVIVGRTIRDMQIDITGCNNNPPIVQPIPDICVEAGDTVRFDVTATDPDLGQSIRLEAIGGPLAVSNNATFPANLVGGSPVTGEFEWATDCSNVRQQPYYVTFKATDNGIPNLVDQYTVAIEVVASAPENLTVDVVADSLELNWDPSICTEATGYDIYRREGYFGFFPDLCEVGVPEYTGYEWIGSVSGLNTTNYLDNNDGQGLNPGTDYCYMVVATFDDGAESYASLEVCEQVLRDEPIIMNVDILSTDATTGEIFVRWIRAAEFDTNAYPGPYQYKLYRAEGIAGGNLTEIATLPTELDTFFTDTGLNTLENPYRYVVEFYDLSQTTDRLIGISRSASSTFLTTTGLAAQVDLVWNFDVPWSNVEYTIYRRDPGSTSFDSITSVEQTSYSDFGLDLLEEYCYFVEARGVFSGIPSLDTLLNKSQESCVITIDSIPPCPPVLSIESDCDLDQNILDWVYNLDTCDQDVIGYEVYFTPDPNGDFVFLVEIEGIDELSYIDVNTESLAGCYAVLAVDSFGNKSALSNIVCADNCPSYSLPNVFTPDGDGLNDLFIPIDAKYVEEIELVIYNRWGSEVFTTNDPKINWDGTNQYTGQKVSDGVYFYVCKVRENRLNGIEVRELSGTIHIFH